MEKITEASNNGSFSESYSYGVVRFATYLDKTCMEKDRLIFASVNLIPRSCPQPLGSQKNEKITIFKIDKNRTIFFRKVVMTAGEAIKWYRTPETEPFKTPRPLNADELNESTDGIEISVSNFFDDPLWPNFGFPIKKENFFNSINDDPTPFTGDSQAKTHRRFGVQNDLLVLKSYPKAIEFLHRCLHINFQDYPEYLGSMALILPDPIIDYVDNYLIPSENNSGEHRLLRFIPRSSENLSDLTITFFELHLNLILQLETRPIPEDGIIIMQHDLPLINSGYFVTHPVHKILMFQPPTGFIRTMHTNVGIIGEKRNVQTHQKEGKNSPEFNYQTHVVTNVSQQVIGSITENEVFNRVVDARTKRRIKTEAERFGQRWFTDSSREDALKEFGKILSSAKKRVIFADPYFSHLQLFQFLPQISTANVEIKIISSKLAFVVSNPEDDLKSLMDKIIIKIISKNKKYFKKTQKYYIDKIKKENSLKYQEKLVKNLDLFEDHLTFLNERGLSTSALVLNENSPRLHDRFLVIDDTVWFIGHSFNSIGVKSSLMIKVPNPAEVINRLEEIEQATINFEEYKMLEKSKLSY
ncbi:VPA1262 family N-terminal domain-containing protein [Acinetobacter sp. NIPH 1869]|uniref:VPA1262 family N-terminal domain-containing protein n=1 Tax=Acinetobacter higginsii TaxID=70347 RepID=UPI001F4A16C7|nr:VPA1262 family N-terminal domain-containing protein [Acinetobacter higginsii]MCH7304883.1 VPA1262 family N-terminal domain-containing protein [Acinetobacter higginsii]